jgi:Putative prokaryotic signal transducing protein
VPRLQVRSPAKIAQDNILRYNPIMFCPVCESEYKPGITRCLDDDAELVEQLTSETALHDSSNARFVTLHTLSSPAEAEMVSDILTQNGVRAVVQSGANDAFSPVFSAVSPGVAVLVDERDLDRARELYASFFGDDTSPLTGPAYDEDTEEPE